MMTRTFGRLNWLWSIGLIIGAFALWPMPVRGGDAPASKAAGVADGVGGEVVSPSDRGSPGEPDAERKPAAGPEGDAVAKPESSEYGRLEVLMASLTIFVLAIFVGFEVITKVPPTLHTPLMSGSNAISGITIVGAIIVAGSSDGGFFSSLVGLLAVAFAAINVVGGFLVTHRMLAMFKKR